MERKRCRAWGRAALAALLVLAAGSAAAQSYPSRPIRIILPYAPSGAPDVLSRWIAQKMSQTTGQQVIVDNKPGASGIVAAELAARSAPDGHTIFLMDGAMYGIVPAVHQQIPYSPTKDFAPITQAVRLNMFLMVNPSLGVSSVKELLTLAKSKSGDINYASSGNASIHHFLMEHFAYLAGIKLTHIPYKGVLGAVPALLSGEAPVMFNSLPSVAAHVEDGKLRILAAGSAQRNPLMPNMPTVAEAGVPGYEAIFNMGYAAPAATPKEIIARLHDEIVGALKSPDVLPKLPTLGFDLIANTPEEFAAAMQKEAAYFKQIVSTTGLKVD